MKSTSIVHKSIRIFHNHLALFGVLYIPSQIKEKSLILIFHGLMDSCEFDLIRKQAEYYVQAGYVVLTMDFNGHGKSDGSLEEMTISKEILDAEAIFEYVQEQLKPDHIFVIGHSQGGIVASALVSNHQEKIEALVLLAPVGMLGDMIRSEQFFGFHFDLNNLPERIPVFNASIGKGYVLDAAQLDLYRYCDQAEGLPVCLIFGSEDSMVSSEVIDTYEKRYKAGNNTITRLEMKGADHEFGGFEKEISEIVIAFFNHNLNLKEE